MAESSGNTIMTLLAKLKLDAQDFDTELSNAQQEAEGFEGPKADPLTLENKDYVDKVEEANTKTSTFGDTVKEIFSGAAANLAAAGVTALINGFIQSVANLMDLAKNLGKDISDNAKEVGISTDEYQKWDRVLQRSGGSAKDLAKGMSNIQTYLDNMDVEKKPKGYQDLASAFDELGVSVKDSEGNLRSTGDILNDVIFALAGMRDGADKANLAQKLLGNNKNLNKFLETTVVDMKELRRSAPILSEDQIESSVRYNDALERMNASLTDLKSTVSIQLLEPLTGVVDAMTAIMNFFNPDSWKDNSVEGKFNSIDKEAEKTSLSVTSKAAQAETYIDKLIELSNKTDQTAQDHEQWAFYADWLITNIPTLKDKIDIEAGALKGEADELKENVAQWKERQKALISERAMADKREVVAQKLQDATDAEIAAVEAEAEANGKREALIEKLNNVLEGNKGLQAWWAADHNGQTSLNTDATAEDIASLVDILGDYGVASSEFFELSDDLNNAENAVTQARTNAENAYADYEDAANKLDAYANGVQTVVNRAGEDAFGAGEQVNELGEAINNLPASKDININIHQNGGLPGSEPVTESKAAGDWYVPYDDFVARLHRGEAVLTASQARRYRNGETGSSFDMDGLVNGIIGAVQTGMAGATVNSYLNGHSINADMSKDTIRQIKSRRFAT